MPTFLLPPSTPAPDPSPSFSPPQYVVVVPTSGFTLDMLLVLNAAIAGGTRSVYYGDKRVEYRSLEEMMAIRKLMMIELGLLNSNNGRRFASFDQGVHKSCGQEGFDTDTFQ